MPGFNNWGKLAAGLKPACQEIIKQVAFEIATDARGLAPVDTGFMSNSIYVSTVDDSTYDAGNISPPGDSYLLPEEFPPDDMSAVVGVAANYGIYVEMGHHTANGSYVPAQPYFTPALEWGRRSLDAELAVLWANVAGRTGGPLVGSVTDEIV